MHPLKKEGAQKMWIRWQMAILSTFSTIYLLKNVELPAKKLSQYLQYMLKVFLEFQTQSNL